MVTVTAPAKRLLEAIKDGTHGTFARLDSSAHPFLSAKNVLDSGLYISEEESSISTEDFYSITNNGFPRLNDVLLTIVGTIGRTCVFEFAEPIAFQRSVAFLRPNAQTSPQYLCYLLRSALFQQQLELATKSAAQGGVYMGDVWKASCSFIPGFAAQGRIANFLDAQTARIDLLIAEKERLASILKAQRGEAIDRTVLGLELPSRAGSMKGLEVLGELPADWESSRMKFELEYVTSGSRGWADFYADEGALFIRIGNLTRDSISLDLSDIQQVMLPDAAEGVRARVRPGDLLISITAYLGSVAVAPLDVTEAYVSQHVSLARPNRLRAVPAWLGYVVLSSVGRTFFDLQAYGGTKVQLSLDDIRELPLPLPPLEVQIYRIQQLEERLARLRELEAHVVAHIDRLREYRSSLISAAVTGQLDIGEFKEAA